jgi:hypothetical protein
MTFLAAYNAKSEYYNTNAFTVSVAVSRTASQVDVVTSVDA